MDSSVRPRFVPPRGTGPIALRTGLHKSPSPSPLFSHSCKRVCISLKTCTFKSLCFHIHAHSFAVSHLFATHTQDIPGVYVPPMLQSFFPDQLVNSTPLLSSTCALFRTAKRKSLQPLCFQSIPHSFVTLLLQVFCLPHMGKTTGVYGGVPSELSPDDRTSPIGRPCISFAAVNLLTPGSIFRELLGTQLRLESYDHTGRVYEN